MADTPPTRPPLNPVTPVKPTASAPSPAPAPHVAPAAAAATGPHFHNGRLTRAGMEHAIRTGGSVLHNGQVINSLGALPSEAQIAMANLAADRQAIATRRDSLSRDEASAKASGNYGHEKPRLDAIRQQIDQDEARLSAATAENADQAMENIKARRAALDAEEEALKPKK